MAISLPATKRRIVFAIKAMSPAGGGAERVLAELSSALARRGHQVTVVSYDPPGTTDFFTLDDKVERLRLGIGSTHHSSSARETLSRMVALRRAVVRLGPDVAVGFMHSLYIPLGLALRGSGIPVIGGDHIVYEHFQTRPLESALLRVVPLVCRKITAVSAAARASYPAWLQRMMEVVPNPVAAPSGVRADPAGGTSKTLLCVGRLAAQKDHATLISAFARIAPGFPEWSLRIVGDGELREPLAAQIAALNLAQRVALPGPAADVGAELRRAQLFVLPSLYESFGLVTAEALAYGLPVIGFADCQGTNELVISGVNGLLVGSNDRIGSLAEGLARLMGDPAERTRMGAAAPGTVAAFAPDEVAARWEQLIELSLFSARR
jgi:glycosyltransferase involved in cell wall biosynthesis